ncbi:unnamed protein product [Adineta steineri]|uniref:UBA domain-containing protein n=1 Tax=Adineta steineri TaxID=433720 RepID=A0A813RY15_9BILA|nr:unnamed protein product [Adineta steineri]CAF0941411.1 unnamed protein product [Adineta steineri]
MSVAAATGAVSTQHHQATAEQIRLAQLIDDKKHDQPEVQEIIRKVLDVVANSNQEDALVALFDCDYDYEKAVALLIEKGHDVASEWRTATNHKMTKKQQQQQKTALNKNGHGGDEPDENGQQRDGSSYRGKSRGGRSRFQQQQNGSDPQNNNNQQQNDNNISQQRQRGGSGYRGRYRGSNRGGYRGNDRNYPQQQHEQQSQDANIDSSLPSDMSQGFTDVSQTNRRGGSNGKQRQWDVGNWNGETVVYSRTSKDDEQFSNLDENNVSNTLHAPSGVPNGQTSSLGISTGNNNSEQNSHQKLKPEFDPIEAARQIKNVIGIGQSQQQQQQPNAPPKPLMDLKPLMNDQQQNIGSSKSFGQNINTKVTPPPTQRIPHQPVIFSDRFDGGMNKIDVQFGSLSETFEDTSSHNTSIPISSSSSSAFYQRSQPVTSVSKQNNTSSSIQNSQRPSTTASTVQHQPTEQPSFISPTSHSNLTRPFEQQPVINQQRILPSQIQQSQQQQQQQQQPSMTMKPVVPPQYALHHQQHQMNAPNLLLQSLLYHHQQPQEAVPLDNSYDPTAFQLPSIDFNTPYYMAAPMSQQPPQQQTQARYLVSQALPPQQQQQQPQTSSNRQQSSGNVQTPPLPNSSSSSSVPSSSTSTTLPTAPKKGPAVPPGIFLSTAPPTQPAYSTAYSTTYGIPPPAGGQQTGAATYSTPYDAEHLFTNAFMQLTNAHQAQSPSGAYGSVTPPVQQQNQQQQQAHNNNDNKTMNYRAPITENLLLLQQYQQYAIQQSNSQQQGQQAPAHSPAPLSYFLGHPPSGPSYSPGPPIMYAQPTTAMAQQQQGPKQQGQQYNQNNSVSGIGVNDDYYSRGSSSASNKDTQYMYTMPAQPQQMPPPSSGQQHQGVNKQQQQQQQRATSNVYNNQQNQQRPFQ